MTTRPVDAAVSCSWQCHKDRTDPPSFRPGIDYGCAYGTPVRAMASGRVVLVRNALLDSFGRFVRIVHDELGVVAEYGHLSTIACGEGDLVAEGEVIARSGASGFLDEWYYGPHLHHNTYRIGDSPSQSFDPESLYAGTAGGGSNTFPTSPDQKDEDMPQMIAAPNRHPAVYDGGSFYACNNTEKVKAAQKIVSRRLDVSTREYDVIKAIALYAQTPTTTVALTNAQLQAIEDAARTGGAEAIRALEFVVTVAS